MENFISVIIITYNNSDTILETIKSIESIKQDDQFFVEKIYCDDGSSDDTTSKIKAFYSKSLEPSKSLKFSFSESNNGIATNINSGIALSTGKYIKIIAGDDLINSDVIRELWEYLECHSSIAIASTCVETFGAYKLKLPLRKYLWFFKLSSACQHSFLKFVNPVPAPGMFLNRRNLEGLNFNTTFKRIEDLPFLLESTKLGHKITHVNIVSTFYRKHEGSLTSVMPKELITEIIKVLTLYNSSLLDNINIRLRALVFKLGGNRFLKFLNPYLMKIIYIYILCKRN